MWDRRLNLTRRILKMSLVHGGSAKILVTDRSRMEF